MTAWDLFDTTLLVCAAIGMGKDEPNSKRAIALIESADFDASSHVFREFCVPVLPWSETPFHADNRKQPELLVDLRLVEPPVPCVACDILAIHDVLHTEEDQ